MDNPYSDMAQENIDCLSRIIDEINAQPLDVFLREQKLRLFEEKLIFLRKIYIMNKFSESQVCRINQLKEMSQNIKPEYKICNGEVFYEGEDGIYRDKESHRHRVPSRGIAPCEPRKRTVYNTPTAIYSKTDGDNHD